MEHERDNEELMQLLLIHYNGAYILSNYFDISSISDEDVLRALHVIEIILIASIICCFIFQTY